MRGLRARPERHRLALVPLPRRRRGRLAGADADGLRPLDAPTRLRHLDEADTIVVPGWSDPDDLPSDALCDALRAAHGRGARVVSLCTGAFVLAEAGLLAGRRATTHWMYVDRLRARHPDVELDPDVLYVVDGNVMTSAGTAAGIDLCLHIVALDHGQEVAVAVARRLVMPPFRAGGQAQYVDNPIATDGLGEPLSAVLDWARDRLGAGITTADLAGARGDEPAHAHATLPRRGGDPARRVDPARAAAARAADARDDRATDRAGRAPCRVRLGDGDARAVRAPAAHLAAQLPRDVPRERRGMNVVDQDGVRPNSVGD